jgi:hypothetical protein
MKPNAAGGALGFTTATSNLENGGRLSLGNRPHFKIEVKPTCQTWAFFLAFALADAMVGLCCPQRQRVSEALSAASLAAEAGVEADPVRISSADPGQSAASHRKD